VVEEDGLDRESSVLGGLMYRERSGEGCGIEGVSMDTS